jgi:pimeloyl-ACP methyl ester carboxylesterase
LISSAQLIELAGLGHMPMMEDAVAVASALKRFLA